MSKPLVYIAGPLSSGWLPDNIRHAVNMAELVYQLGAVPFVPHTLGTLWEFIEPHPHEFWMELCLSYLRRCDGLVRIPGESTGADMEVAFAREHGIPVFIAKSGTRIDHFIEGL